MGRVRGNDAAYWTPDKVRELVGHMETYVDRYGRFPSPAAHDAAILWALHANARDDHGVLLGNASPILAFLSSEPESGKSRCLTLTGTLCPEFYGLDTEATEAYIAAAINENCTICLDEGDILFGAGGRKAAIRAVLNAGYTRHGRYPRIRGGKIIRKSAWGAKAIAGLDVMESEQLKPLLSRMIKIRMVRSQEPVPELPQPVVDAAGKLQMAAGMWLAHHRDTIASAEPVMPEGLINRAAQLWRTMIIIADLIGGDWPARARRAALELSLNESEVSVEPDEPDLMDEISAEMSVLA
jgi:hypothetical protein